MIQTVKFASAEGLGGDLQVVLAVHGGDDPLHDGSVLALQVRAPVETARTGEKFRLSSRFGWIAHVAFGGRSIHSAAHLILRRRPRMLTGVVVHSNSRGVPGGAPSKRPESR